MSNIPTAEKRRVDIHHHFLPPAIVAEQREKMASSSSTVFSTAMFDWSVEKSIEAMDKGGIATAVMSMSSSIWSGEIAASRRRARLCNEFAAQLRRDHDGRFGFFATLPLPDIDGSLQEIEYALEVLKADGIGLMTNYDDKWPGDASFGPVFEELNRRRVAVFFHPHAAGCCSNLVPGVPDSIMEFPFDTTRAITSLLYNGTLARSGDTRFIFTHGGGALPMLADRIAGLAVRRKDLAALMPNGAMAEFRKLNFDVVTATNSGAMSALLKMVPAANLLYGSDFPFLPPRYTSAGLDALGFNPEESHLIERENAIQLLPSLKAHMRGA